jgi:SAM-dependent MidA family methyltransferase
MSLPIPSLTLQKQSQELIALICNKISHQGPIPFSDYMQLALYTPALGYYSSGSQKFGAQGDFITAPEISPLFAQCVANYIQPTLQTTRNILEFGAGSGQLAVDLLTALEKIHSLPEHYYILELSAELQQRQQQKIAEQLPHLLSRVSWLKQLPKDLHAVVIANEVLDAMPVERFCYQDGQFWQYYVDCQQGALQEILREPTPALVQVLHALAQTTAIASEGYHSEINLMMPAWLRSVADSLSAGLVLLFDYGFEREAYYHPQRSMGTLMCHYQHRAHSDPYFSPGLQDITAHVDFTAVAEAATAAGLAVKHYTTQAKFLLKSGLLEIASQLEQSAAANYAITQAIKKLVLPSAMGEVFKVMVLEKE